MRFYNFDFNDAAAIGTCSHCFHPASTDSGARTVKFEKLTFTAVTKRVRYQEPRKGILYDLDGSLTGKGAKSWATPYSKHHEHKGCTHDAKVYDGMVCDGTVVVRRVAFSGMIPDSKFRL